MTRYPRRPLSMDEKRILYLSYDGLTDPLGQSQILPYIKGLSEYGYRFTVISFEKKERFARNRSLIESLAQESGICWVPLNFTVRPPLVSKFYDALRMRSKAVALHKQIGFAMVHCRSYVAADVGLYMKKRFGIKFFFDMRGFWADEKRDGGHWRNNHPVTRRVYRYYKKQETAYLQNADYVITLTEAAKREMLTWPGFNAQVPLQVIPCCADTALFSLTSAAQKKEAKQELALPPTAFVVSYLGSVGTWYMLDEMLLLFKKIKARYRTAVFLFVTPTPPGFIEDAARRLQVSVTDLRICEAPRTQVPALVKASDVNLSLIKPVYSKLSSSPTKLGEVLSMGIPVICNSGVGDVKEIIEQTDGGYVLTGFSDAELTAAADAIPRLLQKDPVRIRAASEPIFSLQKGLQLYLSCYRQILS